MSAIFLHSTGSPPSMWNAAAAAAGLAGRAAPHLGYPPGPAIERPRMVAKAEEVAHVLSQIPADETAIHLVAHSYGGVIALDVAAALGAARLSAITIFEPVMFGVYPDVRAQFDRPEWTDPAIAGSDAWLGRFIDYWNRPGSWDRMPEPMKQQLRGVGWKMYSEVLTCFSPLNTFDHPVLAEVPTRMITGGKSPAPARQIVADFGARYPSIEIVALPDVGHMAPITHPHIVGPALVRR